MTMSKTLLPKCGGDPLLLNGSVHTNDSRFMNGLEGKKLTEAHKRATSASHCGKKDEHTLKKPNTCCQPNEKAERLHEWGFTHTTETKQRLAEAEKQHGERLANMSRASSKRFVVVNPAGEEYVIQNLNAFCREHNLTNSNMTNAAKGKYKHHKGWTRRYFNCE